jgi:hypothetical protein
MQLSASWYHLSLFTIWISNSIKLIFFPREKYGSENYEENFGYPEIY